MRVSPDGWRYKVTPIDRVINDCKRRADDAWWDGNDEEARLHEQEQKLYEQDKQEGVEWVPNFQDTHCHQHLHWHTLLVLFTYGIYMQEETEDGENPNTPFDDVTHWVGNLPRKDTDSTKRVTERSTWRKIKPNILSKELGVEKKQED